LRSSSLPPEKLARSRLVNIAQHPDLSLFSRSSVSLLARCYAARAQPPPQQSCGWYRDHRPYRSNRLSSTVTKKTTTTCSRIGSCSESDVSKMPRAFLLTHRRYNSTDEEDDTSKKGLSPEHSVSTAEHPMDIQMSDSSSDMPDELYNLTKLAEVAVATGQILESRNQQLMRSNGGNYSSENDERGRDREKHLITYTHKLFDKSSRTPRQHLLK
ncbi:hypothetical protein GWI33_000594, partial [Rhynchophorus ferrugineus]